MTLTQLTANVYYWQGAVNFGLITAPERRLILIDSGLDSTNARKAIRPFLEDGWRLAAIVNTHSHADHIGGNADLVRRTGCEVWAPFVEQLFVLRPDLEPFGLYGAVHPPPGLQVKFLQAQPTPTVQTLSAAPGRVTVAGVEMELVPLPGHSVNQVGVVVEGVFFAADGLFMPEVIEKHPLIFLVNVAEYRQGLDLIAGRPEAILVPGHGAAIEGMGARESALAFNRETLARVQGWILAALSAPATEAEVVHAVATAAGKEHTAEPSYFLDRGTVAAHLSDMIHRGQITVSFTAGRRHLVRAEH